MAGWNRFVIGVFLAMLALPGLGLLVGIDGAGESENRVPTPTPVLERTWESWQAWPDAFTRYFEDHFAFRAALVRAQAAIRLSALGVSSSPGVWKGRDGWLFYSEDGAVEDYTVQAPLSARDLGIWCDTLQDTQDWLAAQGIAYAFVIAPDKHAIYPEFLPPSVRRLREQSWADQLVQHLQTRSTVNVIDARTPLIQAKPHERIYHRTDTHWNDRGAYVAYHDILASLRGAHGVVPLPRTAFANRTEIVDGMDLARMLGLSQTLREEDLRLIPETPRTARVVEPSVMTSHAMHARVATEKDDSRLPRLVVFRDSFATGLIPFLSEHFSRALYLWEYDVDPAVVAAEQPQVVIQEIVGRHLGSTLPYNYIRHTSEARRAESACDAGPHSAPQEPPD